MWLLAAIAFNLTRAAGTLASVFHARANTATTRTQLINVPGDGASSRPFHDTGSLGSITR